MRQACITWKSCYSELSIISYTMSTSHHSLSSLQVALSRILWVSPFIPLHPLPPAQSPLQLRTTEHRILNIEYRRPGHGERPFRPPVVVYRPWNTQEICYINVITTGCPSPPNAIHGLLNHMFFYLFPLFTCFDSCTDVISLQLIVMFFSQLVSQDPSWHLCECLWYISFSLSTLYFYWMSCPAGLPKIYYVSILIFSSTALCECLLFRCV